MEELIIDINDLKYNIEQIKNKIITKDYTIIAVIKGNGYGLGIVEYAKILIDNGIEFFAVASIDEAILLRNAGIKNQILLLTPITSEEYLELLIKNDITLTIDSKEGANLVNNISKKLNKNVIAHIKIDTGLSRYGFDYDKVDDIINTITENENINFEGIYSHFSNSLAKNPSFSNTQYSRLNNLIDILNKKNIQFKYKHICNSSGFFKYPNMHLNCARIGSAFLGTAIGINHNLKKIGVFHTKIAKIKTIKKGNYIGYGNSFKTKKDTKIAIIPCGYYKGIGITLMDQRFKLLSKIKKVILDIKKIFQKEYININNENLKILGQIGMHDIVVDITGKNYCENDDIYLYIRPIFIDSSVKRVYKNK